MWHSQPNHTCNKQLLRPLDQDLCHHQTPSYPAMTERRESWGREEGDGSEGLMRTHLPSELVSLDTKTLPPLVHPQCGSGQESSQELPATVLKACCSLRVR